MDLGEAVQTFLNGYFSTCKRSQRTAAAYRVDLRQLRGRFGSDTPLSALSAEQFEAWATELRERRYEPASIRRKFATVRVFFSYALRKGLLDVSPLSKLRLDLGPNRCLPRALPVSDAEHLIEQVWHRIDTTSTDVRSSRDPRFLAIRNLAAVEILFATGMRVGELVALRCQDWYEDDSAFIVKGKGLRERLAILPDQRSRAALAIYLRHRSRMNLAHDGLLINASGARISTQGIARVISAAAKDSKIERRVTPHMIRHTVGTLLLRCGADIRVVQEVLGHASIATTQRYTYVSKTHLFSTLQTQHPNFHLKVELAPQAAGRQLDLPFPGGSLSKATQGSGGGFLHRVA